MRRTLMTPILICFSLSLLAQDKVQIFSAGNEHFRFEHGSLIFKKNENIGIGDSTLFTATNILSNIALGNKAGKQNTTGNLNVFIGDASGTNNTSGFSNTFLGYRSGHDNISGNKNTFLGYLSGNKNLVGEKNIGVGHQALYKNTAGVENIALGYLAMNDNFTGNYNISLGTYALYKGEVNESIAIGNMALQNATSSKSIAIGARTLMNNGSDGNIAIGHEAGMSTTGNKNVFIGFEAGKDITSGEWNTFLGYESGRFATGTDNTFVGFQAGYNTSGSSNCFYGISTGSGLTSGFSNVALGNYALASGGTAKYNAVLGYSAMSQNSGGDYNSVLGYHALRSNGGDNNAAIGARAGYSNSTGTGNVFIGYEAGYNTTESNLLFIENSSSNAPLIYGNFSTNEVGINGQLGVGTETPSQKLHVKDGNLKLENGDLLIDNSDRIYLENTGGVANSAHVFMDNSNNMSFANYSGKSIGFFTSPSAGAAAPTRLWINANGQINIPHVADAGLNSNGDLMIGGGGSSSLLFDQNEIMARNGSSSSPLYIQNEGGDVGINSQGFIPSSTLHIRHPNSGDATSGIRIQNGTSAQHWTLRTRASSPGDLTLYSDNGGNSSWVGEFDAISGAYSATSDARLKKNVRTLQSVLGSLLLLQPSSYQFTSQEDHDSKRYIGLMAQEVAKYFPEAVRYDRSADLYHMNYDVFGVVAIKAIQELNEENEQLKNAIELIHLRLAELEKN